MTFYDKQGVLRCIKSRVFKSTCNGKIKKLHFLISRSIITPPGSAPYIDGLNRDSTIHVIHMYRKVGKNQPLTLPISSKLSLTDRNQQYFASTYIKFNKERHPNHKDAAGNHSSFVQQWWICKFTSGRDIFTRQMSERGLLILTNG